MTRKITVASQKGGVGKTAITVNLAYSLRRLGRKVLIVDGDSQGGVATACRQKIINSKGLVQVLRGKENLAGVAVVLGGDDLAVIGTGASTPEDIVYFEEQAAAGKLAALFNNDLGQYDFVLFDAPVGIGVVTRELFTVSDSFIQVLNCRAGTVITLARLLNLYIWIRKNFNPDLKIEGILFNMLNSSSVIESKIVKQLKSRLPAKLFFDTAIPFDEVFEVAGIKALPLEKLKAGHRVARDFMALAVEVDTRKHQFVGDLMFGDDYDFAAPEESAGEESSLARNRDEIKEILRAMCENGGFYGAVVADEMGFPLADYSSPIGVDALATCSSLLGEALVKAGTIIEMSDVNNLMMDINREDKLVLHRFSLLDESYVLVAICAQEVEALGEIGLATARIIKSLA
ncbi:MAG: ParA family protein [Desulfobulbales bacterium]|nr:ParA family protein [Desulfobulbales bacterium]